MIFQKLGRNAVLFAGVAGWLTIGGGKLSAAGSPTADSRYVGGWDALHKDGWRGIVDLQADGTWTDGSQREGTWESNFDHLTLHFDGQAQWMDRFDLPLNDNVLKGKTAKGDPVKLSLRSALAPAATYAALAGSYDFFNQGDEHRALLTFTPEGTIMENGKRLAYWTVEGNKLYFSFYEHHDWIDVYDLPLKDGVLHGRNNRNQHLTLTQQKVAQANPAVLAARAAVVGAWTFSNATDGKRVPLAIKADGTTLENNGQDTGTWRTDGKQMFITYASHPEWLDTYDLPPTGGVIHGSNRSGHSLSLTRGGAATSDSTATASASVAASRPAAANPAAATPAPARSTAAGTPGYFGSRAPVDSASAAAVAAPTPLPPAATPPPAAPMVGGYRTGSAVASRPMAPAATPTAAPTVAAETPAAALTPVGKWHWHSGGDHTITSSGAVLEGPKVVGQWKWLDKSKGQISVQFTGGAYRAPMTYTLSPHGNHLTGTSPASGSEHTEDRIE